MSLGISGGMGFLVAYKKKNPKRIFLGIPQIYSVSLIIKEICGGRIMVE